MIANNDLVAFQKPNKKIHIQNCGDQLFGECFLDA